jgi:hypothetical protein
MEGVTEMNAKHTEFLAYDRIAELRREATGDRRPVEAKANREPWTARIGAFSARTVGRIRLIVRRANANA